MRPLRFPWAVGHGRRFAAPRELAVSLALARKQAVVQEVAATAAEAGLAIAAEYRGLTAGELTALRRSAREQGVYLRVVKNTLARRALSGGRFACLEPGLSGPLLLAFTSGEVGVAARLFRDFAEQHEALIVREVALEGKLLAPGDIGRLADLPTREQAIARLMAVMRAPPGRLAALLRQIPVRLLLVLRAVRGNGGNGAGTGA